MVLFFFFECYGDPRDLPVLSLSFPTRRSADLAVKYEGHGVMFSAEFELHDGVWRRKSAVGWNDLPFADGSHPNCTQLLRPPTQAHEFADEQIGRAHV